MATESSAVTSAAAPGPLARFLDGDVWYSFKRSPTAIVAAVIALVCVVCSVFAPWVRRLIPEYLRARLARVLSPAHGVDL